MHRIVFYYWDIFSDHSTKQPTFPVTFCQEADESSVYCRGTVICVTCHPHLPCLSIISVVCCFPLHTCFLPVWALRSQRWSSSTKADVRAGLLGGKLSRWTHSRDAFWHLVKLSSSLGIPLGEVGSGWGAAAAAALRPSGPSPLAKHWIFNAQGPHKCMGSMVLSPRHILSLIKH